MQAARSRRSFLRHGSLAAVAGMARQYVPAIQRTGCGRRYYESGPEGFGYFPLEQVDRSSAHVCRAMWTHATGDCRARAATTIECTPVVIVGPNCTVTAQLQVRRLDAPTGQAIWDVRPLDGMLAGQDGGLLREATIQAGECATQCTGTIRGRHGKDSFGRPVLGIRAWLGPE